MNSRIPASLATLVFVTACVTDAGRRRQGNEVVKKEAAQEIRRICALPESEREAEIGKIKKESGMVIYCGTP